MATGRDNPGEANSGGDTSMEQPQACFFFMFFH